jgi:hypothetical protein
MATNAKNIDDVQENIDNASAVDETTTNSVLANLGNSRDESRKQGELKSESIVTCVEVIPTKGSNAGKQMFVINGKHWSRHKPADTDNTVVLEFATWDGGSGWNVIGFNQDARVMSIDAKIAKLTAHDASYSQAIALLLR